MDVKGIGGVVIALFCFSFSGVGIGVVVGVVVVVIRTMVYQECCNCLTFS